MQKKRFATRVNDEQDSYLNKVAIKVGVARSDIIRDGTIKEAKKLEKAFDKKHG